MSSNPTTDTANNIVQKDSDDNLTLEFKEREVVTEKIEPKVEDKHIEHLENLKEEIEKVEVKEEKEVIEEVKEIVKPSLEENEPENKVHSLKFEKRVETGLQIQYTSLKLNTFPIKDSNLSAMHKSFENVNFNNVNVSIGNEVLYNVDVKIHNYEKFKMLELKTREFKIALSTVLNSENTLVADENGYFKYEIFSKIKNSRLFHVIKIFKNIFSGEIISFNINNLKVAVSFENRIRYHKFIMMENSLRTYLDVVKKLHLPKPKNLSDTELTFYGLHLLGEYLNDKDNIDSWISFSIPNTTEIKVGDNISFSRIHKLDFKGIKFDLKETVYLKEPIRETELIGDKINCFKKVVKIKLEEIKKI